jgi:hypothetical protein
LENEQHFEEMLSHIADTLKLTPRRNQVHRGIGGALREPTQVGPALNDDRNTPLFKQASIADITADVNIDELVQAEALEIDQPAEASGKHNVTAKD